jgi:hypothetical protein
MDPDHHRVFMYTPDLSVSDQKESPQRGPPILRAQSTQDFFSYYGVAEAPPGL